MTDACFASPGTTLFTRLLNLQVAMLDKNRSNGTLQRGVCGIKVFVDDPRNCAVMLVHIIHVAYKLLMKVCVAALPWQVI